MAYERVFFRVHAVERMFELIVSEAEVRAVLEDGDVIEETSEQSGDLKRIYLGKSEKKPLHVVAIDQVQEEVTVIVTVYEPSSDRWSDGYRQRITS